MKKTRPITDNDLRRLYEEEGKGFQEIADMASVSCKLAKKWLIEIGVTLRNHSERAEISIARRRESPLRLTCIYCGAEFTSLRTAQYCGQNCWRKAKSTSPAVQSKSVQVFPTIPCAECGVLFTPSTSRQKYHDKNCYKSASIKKILEKYHTSKGHTESLVPIPCAGCGVMFQPKTGGHTFHSKTCGRRDRKRRDRARKKADRQK